MPNYLIFNDSAENLKVQSYGVTSGGTVTGILVESDGTVQVGGSITATLTDTVMISGEVTVTANDFDIRSLSAATDTVSISGDINAVITETVPVAGEVSVTANDFDIRGLSAATDTVSVEGTVTAAIGDTVTVAGEVSVTANDFDIRGLAAATDTVSVEGTVTAAIGDTVTVSVAGHGFTASSLTINLDDANLTSTEFNFDTSQMKQYSFYIVNTGTATISAMLEVSPTTTETYYTPDKSAEITLTQDESTVLVPAFFMNYTRIQVQSSETATAEVYFNGQN